MYSKTFSQFVYVYATVYLIQKLNFGFIEPCLLPVTGDWNKEIYSIASGPNLSPYTQVLLYTHTEVITLQQHFYQCCWHRK